MRIAPLLIATTALAAAGVGGPHAQGSRDAVSSAVPVTFNRDIAPIVYSHCASCHRPGQIGPFSLLTYRDARQHAEQIGLVTSRRLMPPWKPLHGSAEFLDDRSLSEQQIDRIQQWVAQGAVEGNVADLPVVPAWTEGWQLGTPDVIVTMPVPYVVRAEGPDVFRTFVLPIPNSVARYVRALEFQPGNTRVVHHANLAIDRTRSSRHLDELDPEPGYEGGMVPDASYPPGYMLGWTPGQHPRPSPDGMPWLLDGGSDLVVQLHLQPTGKPETVQVRAGLFFTNEAPTRKPVGLRLGSETIDIPAGEREYTIADSYVLPADVDLLAVQPHAHNLGRRMEASALLPDGSTQSIITILDWDFRWQDVYRYTRPVALPKGTTIRMRYTYDNSAENPRNPNRPVRRVLWGPGTSDEMGDLWLQFVPHRSADFDLLTADFSRKTVADDLAAYTTVMHADPSNPLRHDTVAMLHLQAGHVDEAIAQFRESLALNKGSAPTHYNLGIALTRRQSVDEAIAEFGEAVRLDPQYAEAQNNLGTLLLLRGRVADAVQHYRQVVALRPDNAEGHDNLARGLAALGQSGEAISQFQRASTLRPEWAAPVAGSAWVQATSPDGAIRNPPEAIRLAEKAVDLTNRQDAAALDTLAAAYAADGRFDEAVRVATSAMDLATRAGSRALAEQVRQRLALYQRRQPFMEQKP